MYFPTEDATVRLINGADRVTMEGGHGGWMYLILAYPDKTYSLMVTDRDGHGIDYELKEL